MPYDTDNADRSFQADMTAECVIKQENVDDLFENFEMKEQKSFNEQYPIETIYLRNPYFSSKEVKVYPGKHQVLNLKNGDEVDYNLFRPKEEILEDTCKEMEEQSKSRTEVKENLDSILGKGEILENICLQEVDGNFVSVDKEEILEDICPQEVEQRPTPNLEMSNNKEKSNLLVEENILEDIHPRKVEELNAFDIKQEVDENLDFYKEELEDTCPKEIIEQSKPLQHEELNLQIKKQSSFTDRQESYLEANTDFEKETALKNTINPQEETQSTNFLKTSATKKLTYPCLKCDKYFLSKKHLDVHGLYHFNEPTFFCPICEKKCTLETGLNLHLLTHANYSNGVYTCQICKKVYTKRYGIIQHLSHHPDERNYTCSTCGKSYKTKGTLYVHTRIHTSERLYSCKLCDKSFVTNIGLKAHMRSHKKSIYICPTCGKTFSMIGMLTRHTNHHANEHSFVCTTCGKSFSQKNTLQMHVTTHTNEAPYICSECGKGFVVKSQLQDHMINHTNDKIFCQLCGKMYSRKRDLTRHMLIHSQKGNEEEKK